MTTRIESGAAPSKVDGDASALPRAGRGRGSSACSVGGGASLSKAGRGGAASAAAPQVTLLLRHRPSNSLWHSPGVPPMQARLPQSSLLSPGEGEGEGEDKGEGESEGER